MASEEDGGKGQDCPISQFSMSLLLLWLAALPDWKQKRGGVAFKRSFFRSIRQDFSVAYMMYTENG